MLGSGRALWRVMAVLLMGLLFSASFLLRTRRHAARSLPAVAAGARAPAGRFRVEYGPAAGDLEAWRARLRRDRVLERAADRLNAFVFLPQDVTLAFNECGDDDAYYRKRRVTFCYEEVADYAELLAPAASGRLSERSTRRVEAATSFFLFHEAGHALVDVLRIPVTGKEEDAVDQFAIYFLEESGAPDMREDALRAAEVMGRLARADSADDEQTPVWDVHSLDAQRHANLLCWIYGADPRAFGEVVRRAGLPRERRITCGEEYTQLASSWDELLARSLKEPAADVEPQPRALRPAR